MPPPLHLWPPGRKQDHLLVSGVRVGLRPARHGYVKIGEPRHMWFAFDLQQKRSPSSALLSPFLGEGSPKIDYRKKIGDPYSRPSQLEGLEGHPQHAHMFQAAAFPPAAMASLTPTSGSTSQRCSALRAPSGPKRAQRRLSREF